MELYPGAVVVMVPPSHPVPTVAPPAPRPAPVIVPIPGLRGRTGRDAADLSPDQVAVIVAEVTAALPATTYLHVQNSAVKDWPITHPLEQPVSAVHVVSGGEDVLVPWVEMPDRTVIVSFGAPASGTATLT